MTQIFYPYFYHNNLKINLFLHTKQKVEQKY